MTVGVLPICPRNTGLRAKETDALVYSGWEVFYVLNQTYLILASGVTSYYKKIRRKLIHFSNIVCPSPLSNSLYILTKIFDTKQQTDEQETGKRSLLKN